MSENITCTLCRDTGVTATVTDAMGTRRTWCTCDAGHIALNDFLRAGIKAQDEFIADKPKFTLLKTPEAPPVIETVVEELPPEVPSEDSNVIQFKAPVELLIERELKTKRFILAFYDEDGNIGFYNGDGIGPEDIALITDIMKARLMNIFLDE